MLLTVICVMSLAMMGTRGQQPSVPPRCCFEKEFTAKLGEVGGRVDSGHAHAIVGSVDIAYDFYRRRIATKSKVNIDGEVSTISTLYDYVNRMMYISPLLGDCTYHQMPVGLVMYPTCISDNATYLGSATFGYGTETLKINAWQFPMAGDVVAKIAVSEDCVPVFEASLGHMSGAASEITYLFTSYSPGIDDMNSLEEPAGCIFVSDPVPTSNRPIGR